VQQIVLQAMEDMKLDAMITPTGKHPAVRPWPAARADAQQPDAVDLELPRHAGFPELGMPSGWTNQVWDRVRERVGTGRHALQGSADAGEAAAVGDVVRAAVQRADALQDRGGV